ncbi:MAG: Holliday junction resolvase RuvX [Deltaproteobacteria bacterium]|nr:Holliday junction resolvase RuvX [Deltaproteobacteria bacterium]
MRILALDLGAQRIGVAGTDPLGWTAQPLGVIRRRLIEQDLDEIMGYIQNYSIQLVLVGLPLRGTEGTVGIQAHKTFTFCEQLKSFAAARGFPVRVETWDESMTTHEAQTLLRAAGATAKRRKKAVDKLAAAMLLTSYLQAQQEETG